MIELAPRSASPIARFGGQPIAIAAAALVIVVVGVTSITLWRAYTGSAPETERVVATRQLQARAAQASEQLVEKTKGLEATQKESINQLQVVQDQLLTVRRLLAAQQADNRKLSEQVGTLTEAIDGLRQSATRIDRDISFLSWELRPTELENLGLVDALSSFVREWSAQYGHLRFRWFPRRTAAAPKRAADRHERRLAMKPCSAG